MYCRKNHSATFHPCGLTSDVKNLVFYAILAQKNDEKQFFETQPLTTEKLADEHKFLVNRIHKFSSSARHRHL